MKLNQITNTKSDVEICGLSSDSREIKPGFLFGSLNGNQYVADAVAKGAAAIIAPEDFRGDCGNAILIKAKNPNLEFAKAASRFYGKAPKHICAVTGTNGKTSIADFIRQILNIFFWFINTISYIFITIFFWF